jgi:hypothetical protein
MLLKQLFILFISSLLLACAGSPAPAQDADPGGSTRRSDCISTGTIRDYQVLDDSNLVVTGSGNRKYHVWLSRRAIGLGSAWKIGFRSRSGRICGSFDDILVDDGFGPEQIRISGIRQLTPGDYDELLVRFGKMEPAVQPAPATDSVETAEVEELD